MCIHNICFEQNYENDKKNQLKINIFTAVKYCSILHGRVFVMHLFVCLFLHPEADQYLSRGTT